MWYLYLCNCSTQHSIDNNSVSRRVEVAIKWRVSQENFIQEPRVCIHLFLDLTKHFMCCLTSGMLLSGSSETPRHRRTTFDERLLVYGRVTPFMFHQLKRRAVNVKAIDWLCWCLCSFFSGRGTSLECMVTRLSVGKGRLHCNTDTHRRMGPESVIATC